MTKNEGEFIELMGGQLGIWYAQQLAPENRSFFLAEYIEIHGPVDHALLVRAAELRIHETETARLRLKTLDGTPAQYLHDAADYPVRTVDLSGETDPRAAARAWMDADLRRPAELDGGPLYNAAIITLGEELHYWYIRVHHLVFDGQSGVVAAARGAEIYDALLEGRDPAEGALAPFSVLHEDDRAYRTSAQYDEDRLYWLDRLAGHPALDGGDAYKSRRAQHAPLRHTDGIDTDAADSLKRGARRLRTSFPGLMIAAAALYQHRVTGEREITVGLPVRARGDRRTLAVPGMTSNILPLRLSIGPRTTVEDLVRQTSRAVRDGMRHQRYRYRDMLGDLKITDGDLCGLHINVMAFDYDLRFGTCPTVTHNLSTGPVDNLRIDVYDRGGMQINVDANPDAHDLDEAAAVSRHYLNVATWLAHAEPTALAAHADLLDEGERGRVLVEWNDTATEPVAGSLVDLFEAQAARSPEADALVWDEGDEVVSYGELDARANRLARHLAGLGVGPESVVGVCLERGPEMVVALLAALKAGGAYLPVDPDHPTDRIAQLLADAAPVAVVTSAAIAPSVPASDAALVVLEQTPLTDLDDSPLGVRVDPRSPAYVIFTSGSTGRPKGVVVPHAGIVNRL
ncbi:condensation domain-containing protein, partial [Streptomyces sp. NPDC020807]|uniref:condensation domain-containing protein n=1 Tax=Streptomyces sp. NPDC020807 TaxID=3155119 RepID=UPI0033C96BDF